MKAVDEIALLESIEEQAATYSPSTPINHTTTTTTTTNTTELYPSVLLSNPSPPINFQLGSSSPHTVSPTSVPSPSSSVATLPANEKPYKCPICPKSFTRNYDLQAFFHFLLDSACVQTSETRISSHSHPSYLNYLLLHLNNSTRHKSSHQDARIHVCRHCGRSFNRRDALSRHNIVRGCGQNGRVGTRHLQKTPS